VAGLVLEGIAKRYRDVIALQPTDLRVENGTLLTLLGPSGCGKTTTLRIIAGFTEPDSGRVLIDGADLTHAPPRKRNVGVVFQDYALFPHLSVAENIAFGLRERGASRAHIAARTAEMLLLVQLEGMAHRHPAQLSGGQQQRVALARALAHPPRLLLMDEPFSALDASLREGLRAELRRIQQQLGITTLFITHDRQEAMALSDSIGVMRGGRILQLGTPRDLYMRPNSREVAEFLGAVNVLDVQAHRAAGRALALDTTSVRIGVRPENISISTTGAVPPGAVHLPGRVTSTIYHGSQVHVSVDIGAATWTVYLANRAAIPPREILLTWAPEDTLHF
jgi:ABC-type Fe3+/spermidine/putrescine transport system ATPase subunit